MLTCFRSSARLIFIILYRVEALRQEFGDSPSRSLSTTMISPTQVVLGRSAPYFVPSGERAQGPIVNIIATPEHIPESDKVFDKYKRIVSRF